MLFYLMTYFYSDIKLSFLPIKLNILVKTYLFFFGLYSIIFSIILYYFTYLYY